MPGVFSPTALDAAGSIDAARVLARLLMVGLVAFVAALVWTPWQQSLTGSGRVIAYAPLERQQPVEAPFSARVVKWHVQEGDHVDKGDPIVDLSDNDPELLQRLERQRQSVLAQLDAATLSIAVAEARVSSLQSVRSAAVVGVGLEQQMAGDRKLAASEAVDAAEARNRTAKLNVDRQRRLHEKGLSSTRTLELAELEMETAEAELEQAKASFAAAKRAVKAAGANLDRTGADTQAKIEAAQESLQKARSERGKAEGELAKIDVQLARQNNMQITAPRAGSVFRLVVREGGEQVKAGDELAILVPDTTDRAVELWVDGNDAPFITEGRHVRLQFEGWPAVQFVGWPSVAVGTFGGTVAFVDATDDGKGHFRIVVVPDEGEPWPEPRYLRQGVRAHGWVLLNQVSLGYELWRQFNGFPPAVAPPETQPSVRTTKPTIATPR
jgi:biotin carboxyl carrier protein